MSRGLLSELSSDARSAKLPAAVSTGFVMTLMVVSVQTSIASIIFAGPLSPFVALGAGAALFGTSALCLVTALAGSYPGTISLPQFPVAAVLVTISAAVGAGMASAPAEALLATMMVILVLSTVVTGLCFSVIGWARLSNLFRFMPYPLVGGFLAGLGWVLSVSGIRMSSGIELSWDSIPRFAEPSIVWRWVASAVYALVLFVVMRRWPHYLIVPASIVLGTGLCSVALLVLGIPHEEARSAGILFVGLPEGYSWPVLAPSALHQVDWGMVALRIPGILSVVLIALMCIVLNAGALELGTGARIDMNREFRAEGAACLLASLGPSVPGCNVVQMSLMSRLTGAESRFTGITVAATIAAVLLFGGGLLGTLPVPLLGGLVLFIGLGLIRDWVFGVRKSIPGTDYAIILAVSAVICVSGFVQGVALGLVAAVIFFVVHFSRVDVVGDSFTGREQRSARGRSAVHRAILREQGERIRVYRLRGYIIFGNAAPMGDRVEQALEAKPGPLCLVLDFAGVSGFDVSAANVISRCIRTARARKTRVVLSAISGRTRGIVERVLGEDAWRDLVVEDDLHRSLEWCEDHAIAEWERTRAGSTQARDALFASSIDQALTQMERQAGFEALIERLRPWVEERAYAAGEVIVEQGEGAEGMQLFVEGRARAARATDSGTRMEEYEAGDALMSEAALGRSSARVSVAAVGACRTVLMTQRARRSLERDDPTLALDLDRYLIETIAEQHKRRLPGGDLPANPG